MWEEIHRKGCWEGDIWNRRKNGELYPEHLSITAVKDDSGEITHYVGTLGDITERKQAEEQIRDLAFYDALTHLPNRRLLNDRLEQAMVACKRSGRYGALMFLDLDNFKPLNDKHGHAVGDLLLIEVAMRISNCVREIDTVARFGGDEFMVLIDDLEKDKAESTAAVRIVAEKIREALSKPYVLRFMQEDKSENIIEHHSTASIGVTLFNSQEAGMKDIVKCADIAMYQSKKAGRNKIQFYNPKS
jgi:diguanylate cyclase (GGDEF)-like protein